ncbi:hypothetical protein GLV98_10375 [Halobacillus litoralis]|uniref:DUF4309 domain-containing protein n=1 Tax=Halobacillus litoralis TaxID=45668 RepID=A0A845E2G7_9BACI|nr:DUF5626 family protein [Halobacillus litoralis]MYL49894.1 hypothetical protein [Halobacillus litoralis]
MKKIVSLLVLMLVLGVFGTSVSAEDSEKEKFSNTEKKQLVENFTELGIDKQTQKKLIKKLENGEALDSMKQENLNAAKAELGESKTITFEDGSRLSVGSEAIYKDTGFPMQSLSAGTRTVKSYWYTGFMNYSFETDFVIRSGSDNDYILKSYNPNVSIIGGSYSGKKVTVMRKYETSTRRAYSRMDFDYSVPTGQGSIDLYFQVGDNDYETTLSRDDVK